MSEVSGNRPFPSFGERDWRALVHDTTSGKSVEDLAFSTEDAIRRLPLYGQTAPPRLLFSRSAAWSIVQRIDHGDVAEARRQILDDITGAADAVDMVFSGSPSAYGRGLPLLPSVVPDLTVSLPRTTGLRFDAGEDSLTVAAEAVGSHGVAVIADTAAILASQGFLRRPLAGHTEEIAAFAAALEGTETTGVLVADGRVWHAGGATAGQELAAVLASFTALFRLLAGRGGLSPARAASRLGVALAVDANRLGGIAKLRAARLLLGRLLEAAGIAGVAVPIHAETSWRMLSRRDVHTNVLRSAAAAFAAIVGGCDSLTVLPHTLAGEMPDAHARRLARNTQTILHHEAQLHRVADPASGAGAVESLTAALAEAAWEKFRAIEAAGGILAVVLSGRLQAEIAGARDARAARLRDGAVELVGTTLFPADAAPAAPPLSAPELPPSPAVVAPPLVFGRLAEPDESTVGQLDAGGQRGRNVLADFEDSPPMMESG